MTSVSVTYEVRGSDEPTRVLFPRSWIMKIDPTNADWPIVGTFVTMKLYDVVQGVTTHQYWSQVELGRWHKLHADALHELDLVWSWFVNDIDNPDNDITAGLQHTFISFYYPNELQHIIDTFMNDGPHRIIAPEKHLILLARLLEPHEVVLKSAGWTKSAALIEGFRMALINGASI